MSPSQRRRLVARNIRHRAKAKRMPLNSLADLAGVSRSQLYDVLRFKKAASTNWISRLANALDAEPSDLLKE